MYQLSKQQAKAIWESRIWEKWTDLQILQLQLFQNHLCMPFGKYHSTLEKYLRRPVYTYTLDHQKDKLIKEVFGSADEITIGQVFDLIPFEILQIDTIQV